MIEWCRRRGIESVCADVEASTSYTEIDWTGPSALILGPESTGFTAEELESADEVGDIPMKGAAESLNVSVAAGILLFEALVNDERQEQFGAAGSYGAGKHFI